MQKAKSALPLTAIALSSCAGFTLQDKYVEARLLSGQGYTVISNAQRIEKGQDASFKILANPENHILSLDYPRYEIAPTKGGYYITLLNVQDSVSVSVKIQSQHVRLHRGDGTFLQSDEEALLYPQYRTRMRENAPSGLNLLHKEGHLQIGWHEMGKDDFIGFGWRYSPSVQDLYPVFVPYTEPTAFDYITEGENVTITATNSAEETIVIPAEINGKTVTKIETEAIVSNQIKHLILPPNPIQFTAAAVVSDSLEKITLFDCVAGIDDVCLQTPNLKTLEILAHEMPMYSGTYWDVFQDKIDYLESIKDKKKIILFSGSSGRYGYDSSLIHEALPDYEVVNMGVFAYIGALEQLDVIKPYCQSGDILLHTPEFDAIEEQFCARNNIYDRFFNCLESGYQEFANIDLRNYKEVFTPFTKYLAAKTPVSGDGYRTNPRFYDDDNHFYYTPTYNIQGDMIMKREPTQQSGRIYQRELTYQKEYLFDNNVFDLVGCLNNVYKQWQDFGVNILFSYAPKNIDCLEQGSTKEKRAELHQYLKSSLCVPVLEDIEDSFYPAYDFYLIDNHLTNDGAKLRTEKTITALKKLLML